MNQKENQRVMLTKRLLKDALIRLLNGKSIDEISVTELCRESGINRSTFYHHYGSPYDVLAEMEQTMLEDIQDSILQINSNDLTDFASIWRQLESICKYLKEDIEMAKLFFGDNRISADLEKKLLALPQVRVLITRYLPPNCDEDAKNLLLAFFDGGFFSLVRRWLMEEIPKSPGEISNLFCAVITQGIGGTFEGRH